MWSIYIGSNSLRGGAERRAIKICKELNNFGIPCKLLLRNSLYQEMLRSEFKLVQDQCLIIDDYSSSVLSIFYEFTTRFSFSYISKLRNYLYLKSINVLISKYKITLVHVFLDIPTAARIKVQTILEITQHGMLKSLSPIGQENGRLIEDISHFNAVSNSVYIKAKTKIPETKLSVAPTAFFDPVSHEIDKAKVFESKENVVLFAHRLSKRKNGLLFAKVAVEFLRNHPDWKVYLFGKGKEDQEIREILQTEIENGRARVGYIQNVMPEMVRSKIFVSLIEPDNYPSQSVLEAMHTGNALLLSDRGFTEEKFLDGNGFLCEINFDDVLCKLNELVSNQERLEEFGICSMDLMKARFHKELYLNYLVDLYRYVEETNSKESHT